MAKEFFDGEDSFVQIKVKIIKSSIPRDIIDQYINFCHIFKNQSRLHKDPLRAIFETIRICKEDDILKEYLYRKRKGGDRYYV